LSRITLGEHIRKHRLVLQMSRKQAAVRLGVGPETVRHWEAGETKPPIERVPAVLQFLGYDPFPDQRSFAIGFSPQDDGMVNPGGEDEFSKLRPSLPIVERATINAILWNPRTDEILCLDWEKFGWRRLCNM
jgi:transcriptional regulator with XRE-family HTH domain